jgi:hypothetical protein
VLDVQAFAQKIELVLARGVLDAAAELNHTGLRGGLLA